MDLRPDELVALGLIHWDLKVSHTQAYTRSLNWELKSAYTGSSRPRARVGRGRYTEMVGGEVISRKENGKCGGQLFLAL